MKKVLLLLAVNLFLIWFGLYVTPFPFNIILPALGGFWFGSAIRQAEKIKISNKDKRMKFNAIISERLNKINI